jgi:hypothetical protein
MVAVVVVGVPLGVCMERRSRFLALAEWHRSQAMTNKELSSGVVIDPELPLHDNAGRVLSRDEASRVASQALVHMFLMRKYRRAAEKPWLPVEPDSPKYAPPL